MEDFAEIELVEALAREIHRRYAVERQTAGETVQENAAILPFEQLAPDIRRSNYDNAAHIPTKLKSDRLRLPTSSVGQNTGDPATHAKRN